MPVYSLGDSDWKIECTEKIATDYNRFIDGWNVAREAFQKLHPDTEPMALIVRVDEDAHMAHGRVLTHFSNALFENGGTTPELHEFMQHLKLV